MQTYFTRLKSDRAILRDTKASNRKTFHKKCAVYKRVLNVSTAYQTHQICYFVFSKKTFTNTLKASIA